MRTTEAPTKLESPASAEATASRQPTQEQPMNTLQHELQSPEAPRLQEEPQPHQRPTQPPQKATNPQVIRARAFEIFRARQANGAPGDHLTDWAQAERELNARKTELIESKSRVRGETLLRGND
jgi:hypothetical protein